MNQRQKKKQEELNEVPRVILISKAKRRKEWEIYIKPRLLSLDLVKKAKRSRALEAP
jgi:hypothetical protein